MRMAQAGQDATARHARSTPRPGYEFEFSSADLARVQRLMFAFSSVTLRDHKESMVYNRLSRRLRATGYRSFKAYLDWVEDPGSGERENFVNALTTNLTSFFRESHHFDMLAARIAVRQERTAMRVWSCACSTGQEAWSAAIVLRETGQAGEILATDIDSDVLRTAAAGIYRRDQAGGLDPARLRRFFLRGTDSNDGMIKVGPDLHSMVKFQMRNLLAPAASAGERFDAIFCRNVAIYFDTPAQRQLLERLTAALVPGGLLFVGQSEMFPLGYPGLRSCGHTAYERVAG
jgi:chemotaxis protein methyltransferase CheR